MWPAEGAGVLGPAGSEGERTEGRVDVSPPNPGGFCRSRTRVDVRPVPASLPSVVGPEAVIEGQADGAHRQLCALERILKIPCISCNEARQRTVGVRGPHRDPTASPRPKGAARDLRVSRELQKAGNPERPLGTPAGLPKGQAAGDEAELCGTRPARPGAHSPWARRTRPPMMMTATITSLAPVNTFWT